MIRNGRTPTLLLVGLVILILIISYNHWSLSQKNVALKDALFLKEEKLNDLMEKKAYVEKQVNINSDRIKYFEERIEANSQALKQKDTEIDDLNTRLRSKIQENDKLLLELNEIKDSLNSCKSDKEKFLGNAQAKEMELEQEIQKLKQAAPAASNCNNEVEAKFNLLKTAIMGVLRTKMSEADAQKFDSLFKLTNLNGSIPELAKDPLPVNNQDQSAKVQIQQPILVLNESAVQQIQQEARLLVQTTEVPELLCKLPKAIGDCLNSTERYFYDLNSEKCLIFSYSGCNGNQNNFASLEECTNRCSNKSINTNLKIQETINNSNTTVTTSTTTEASNNIQAGVNEKIAEVVVDNNLNEQVKEPIINEDNNENENNNELPLPN